MAKSIVHEIIDKDRAKKLLQSYIERVKEPTKPYDPKTPIIVFLAKSYNLDTKELEQALEERGLSLYG